MAGSGRCAPTSTCGERGEKRGESGVSPYPLAAPALPPCSTHSVGSPTSSTAANAAAVGQPAAADPPSSKSAAVCAPAGCGEPRRRRRQTCLWRWRRWRRRWSWQQWRLRCWWWASKGRGGRRGCVREGGRDSGFSGGYGVGGGSYWGRGGGKGACGEATAHRAAGGGGGGDGRGNSFSTISRRVYSLSSSPPATRRAQPSHSALPNHHRTPPQPSPLHPPVLL